MKNEFTEQELQNEVKYLYEEKKRLSQNFSYDTEQIEISKGRLERAKNDLKQSKKDLDRTAKKLKMFNRLLNEIQSKKKG